MLMAQCRFETIKIPYKFSDCIWIGDGQILDGYVKYMRLTTILVFHF